MDFIFYNILTQFTQFYDIYYKQLTQFYDLRHNELTTLLPIIISSVTLAITAITLIVGHYKLKQSEQVKMVHDIQLTYNSALDKFKESVKKYQSDSSKIDDLFYDYLDIVMPLQWYLFLRKKKQMGKLFDNQFQTYFKAIYIPYIVGYKSKMKEGKGYDLVLKKLQKMEIEEKKKKKKNNES